ncbi:hypothetical protein [Gordonia iterans]
MGAHRKPSRREVRRAEQRAERAEQRRTLRLNINTRKAALAAGAVFATAAVALAPAAHAETAINAQQNAEHDYATWNNLIIVADSLGTTQGAILAPIGSLAPDGTLPTVSNGKTSDSQKLTFIDGLGEGAGMLIQQPNTGHVPGAGGALGMGALAALLPQGLAGAPLLDGVLQSTTILPKTTATLAALTGLDATTAGKNVEAEAKGLLGDKVVQSGGYALSALNLGDDPLNLLGLPDAQRTTDSWSNAYDWPLLQINGTTWMVQDRITVDPVTSEALKQKYADRIGTLDTLDVQKGRTTAPIIGYEERTVTDWDNCTRYTNLPFVGPTCTRWGTKVETVPQYGPIQFVPELDENGDPIYETVHDPNAGVPGALANLDGIDIPGMSVTKREAGGEYNFLDGSLGWLVSTTQVAVGDQVVTVPLVASGIALPFGLLEVGGLYSPGMVTQNGQTTSATLGTRSQGIAIPVLGIGVDTTSLLESWQYGPDGIAYNSGQTIALVNTGELLGGVPLPLVYSLGAFNLGPKGVGFSGPSIFGVGLPSFQLGEKLGQPDTGNALLDGVGGLGDMLPTTLIPLDPKYLFAALGIEDPTGLGLTDPFKTTQDLFDPVFVKGVSPLATPLAKGFAELGAKTTNKVSESSEKASKKLREITTEVADTASKASDKAVKAAPEIEYPIEVKQSETTYPEIEIKKNDDGLPKFGFDKKNEQAQAPQQEQEQASATEAPETPEPTADSESPASEDE